MKKLASLLLLLCFLKVNSFSQNAPDFTVTFSNGETKSLYQNYLDSGKTVVLKLFFTTCPPCIAISPKVEQLYKKWGKGKAGVEFISLSVLSTDNASKVNTFKQTYGISWPGAGADGGSLTANLPYRNGTFGPYFGTPTFVVIGPDKQVKFDPRGNSNDATIDSIDAAIRATGKLPPRFISGTITNPCGLAVKNAKVVLQRPALNGTDLSADTVLTDVNGNYAFDSLPIGINGADYQARVMPVFTNANISDGVSTFDIVQIRKHILQLDTLNLYQQAAADVNLSNNISTLDLVDLRKVLLRVVDTFPKNNNGGMYYTDSTGALVHLGYRKIPLNNQGPFLNYNFVSVKTGDVNCSAVNLISPEDRAAFQLDVQDQSPEAGQIVLLPVKAGLSTNLQALQLAISTTGDLQFEGVESGKLPIASDNWTISAKNDLIKLSWDNIPGIGVEPNDVLFSIRFSTIRQTQLSKSLEINNKMLLAEATHDGNVAPQIQFNWKQPRFSTGQFTIVPNPANSTFVIPDLKSSNIVRIFNCLGQEIPFTRNNNTFYFPDDNLPSGLYVAQVYEGVQLIGTEKLILK